MGRGEGSSAEVGGVGAVIRWIRGMSNRFLAHGITIRYLLLMIRGLPVLPELRIAMSHFHVSKSFRLRMCCDVGLRVTIPKHRLLLCLPWIQPPHLHPLILVPLLCLCFFIDLMFLCLIPARHRWQSILVHLSSMAFANIKACKLRRRGFSCSETTARIIHGIRHRLIALIWRRGERVCIL